MPVQLIALAALAVLGAGFAWLSLFKTVRVSRWERGAVFVDGGFERMLPPGRHRVRRSVEVRRIATGPQYMPVGPVDAVTSEGLPIRVSAMVFWRIVDAERSLDFPAHQAVQAAVTQALIRFTAGRELAALMARGEGLDEALQAEAKAPEGLIAFEQVALGAVVLPPELRRMVTEVERARLEGRAALERARGEHAALRALANAARMLKDNPELMQLRLLQSVGTAKGATLVLGDGAIQTAAASRATDEIRPAT